MAKKNGPNAKPTVKYSVELGEAICERMAAGETLTNIVKDEGMPTEAAIYVWRKQHLDFFDAFAQAREDQMQAWADQIVTLSDDAESDFTIILGTRKGDIAKFDGVHVRRAELQIKTRQWLMERIMPGLFGLKQTVDVNHRFADLDDDALTEQMRSAAEAAGMTAEEMLDMIGVEGLAQ